MHWSEWILFGLCAVLMLMMLLGACAMIEWMMGMMGAIAAR